MDIKQINKLENSLNYVFKDKDLLLQSLSHPSLNHSQNTKKLILDYERFELLGDAILNFVITEILFLNYKNFNEGKLAKIRATLVCKDTICKIAANIDLASYIIMTEGEETSGGRKNANNIENAMEAVLAAIYLDSDIETVKKIILSHWHTLLTNSHSVTTDPKTALQEWSQEQFHLIPEYKVIEKTGPAHSPFFIVNVEVKPYSATGTGHSIKAAEKDAAKNILDKIDIKKNHHERLL
jgi:ribonuclease III